MSMKQLASLVGVSAMTISYYESGERKPGMDMIRALAKALGVRTTDFLNNRNTKLVFAHGEFRKSSKLLILRILKLGILPEITPLWAFGNDFSSFQAVC